MLKGLVLYMKKNKLVSVAVLSTITVGTIYAINKSISIYANAQAALSNPNALRYQWRFGNIFYTKQGEGKPVLLIHDLTCGSSDLEWKSIVGTYAKNHTVYTIDLLGCGRSDKPALTYTNYMYVQLITDFIKNIIGHRTDVVATGSSSSIALMACYNDDTLFDKIMLINPSHIESSSSSKINTKLSKLLLEMPLIGTLIFNISNTRQRYRSLFQKEYFYNPFAVKTSSIKNYYDASHYGTMTSKYLFASLAANYTGINTSRAVKDINNSIYILSGEFDENSKEIATDYQELNPSIEVSVINKTKHLPQLENPNAVINAMSIFFN